MSKINYSTVDENGNPYTCQFCGKVCTNKMSKVRHEYFCKENPDIEYHMKTHQAVVKASQTEETKNKIRNTKHTNSYKVYNLTCPKCGKEFTIELRDSDVRKRGLNKICCSSKCSHSRIRTEETKRKISEGVKKFNDEHSIVPKPKISKPIVKKEKFRVKEKPPKKIKQNKNKEPKIKTKTCIFCGKTFEVFEKSKRRTCSDECLHNIKRRNSKIGTRKLIEENRFVGWKSRGKDKASYAERFFMNVLENNGIDYQFEYYLNKRKDLGVNENCGYFLDFKIGNNIDLEIDGKQHWKLEERIESDKHRDEILTNAGWKVYRIRFNEVVSEEGKKLMEEKIQVFLKWLSENMN